MKDVTADEIRSRVFARVLLERMRQIEVEDFTIEHDDAHGVGELSDAAACYALNAGRRRQKSVPALWPWSLAWWKPRSRQRDLERAAALIIAELERLDRKL